MEDPKPAQDTATQNSIPPSTAQTAPPQPSAPSSPDKGGKKRPLDINAGIQNSPYFKMRLILKDLRPHFIEVLRTPDFLNCKAAQEICEKMKVMMELYQQMIGETDSTTKSKNVVANQPLSSENGVGQKQQEQFQTNSPANQYQPESVTGKPSEDSQSSIVDEIQLTENGQTTGSYIVGGSAFGWNFITFSGGKSVYYGVTKQSFRSGQQAKAGGE
ncbi:uncharacterized protein LOC110819524 [Carica papaya]|uniref:uncharacterized protein LOC110819524 n=1 Tax=Carica papaya TaxID=3649 RepID=UPI000B8CF503|nr:uncharacterized protein LOC110819524 [Carica papaya]